MFARIDHIGVAVEDLDGAIALYEQRLGMPLQHRETVEEQGVEAVLLGVGESHVELLRPLGPDTAVGKFLARSGPGLHHVAYGTDDIDSALEAVRGAGLQLIDEQPRTGIRGSRVAFLHPKSTGGVLTELLSWRWSLYVNLLIAIPAVVAALSLLVNVRPADRPRLDLAGTLTASAGLFGLVYGFSHAESSGWGDPVTVAMLAGGVALLALFAWIETRVASPLLPLRVVLDRDRGGAYLSMLIGTAGLFGIFLFLTLSLTSSLCLIALAKV